MIKALIFDFDGLILDTETPEVEVWRQIYAEHGFEFPLEQWVTTVGGYGLRTFDAAEHLASLAQRRLEPEGLRNRHRSTSDLLTQHQSILPGVHEILNEARQMGLRLAVASSSPHAWVDDHLARLDLSDRFEFTICADDVPTGRTKPYPDLFLKALAKLQLKADEAIVFEDSPNGVQAAQAASILVVMVPNPVTAQLDPNGANLVLNSLAGMPLGKLLRLLK